MKYKISHKIHKLYNWWSYKSRRFLPENTIHGHGGGVFNFLHLRKYTLILLIHVLLRKYKPSQIHINIQQMYRSIYIIFKTKPKVFTMTSSNPSPAFLKTVKVFACRIVPGKLFRGLFAQ